MADLLDPDAPGNEAFLELLQRAQADDANAWTQLVGPEEPCLRQLVARKLGCQVRRKEDADDVVQKSLKRAWQKIKTCQANTEAQFRGWLQTIAERQVSDTV